MQLTAHFSVPFVFLLISYLCGRSGTVHDGDGYV